MKKVSLVLSTLCFGALLVGCGSTKYTASQGKSKLEKAGYTSVRIETPEEYSKKLGVLVEAGEGFENYLVANKVENEVLKGYASLWYFDKNENADTFRDKNIGTLVETLKIKDIDLKVGSHNNVVYVCTEDVVSTLGLTI